MCFRRSKINCKERIVAWQETLKNKSTSLKSKVLYSRRSILRLTGEGSLQSMPFPNSSGHTSKEVGQFCRVPNRKVAEQSQVSHSILSSGISPLSSHAF